MKPVFFTRLEAQHHVGEYVKATSDFPSVPAGTIGRIARTRKVEDDGWLLKIEWALPRRRSIYFATVLNFSFNFQRQSALVTDEFSKDEFQRLVVAE